MKAKSKIDELIEGLKSKQIRVISDTGEHKLNEKQREVMCLMSNHFLMVLSGQKILAMQNT